MICDHEKVCEGSTFCVKCLTGFAWIGMKAVQYISVLGEKDVLASMSNHPENADVYREIHDKIVGWNRERLKHQKNPEIPI